MRNDSLDALCTAIGYLLVGIIIFAIPILTTLSFVFNWYPGVKFLLTLLSALDYLGLLVILAGGER